MAAPASAAPDYVLFAAGIQQTVLRAQMPSALGAWRQNIHFAEKDAAPYVCWSAIGSPVALAALKKVDCPDSAKVSEDGSDTAVTAHQANTQKMQRRASALSTRWHRQVLAAYESFGSGNSR